MMTWMLLDEAGNMIATYDDEVEAHVSMRSIVAHEPDARDSILLLAYDEEGLPLGEAVTYDDLPPSTVNLRETPVNVVVLINRMTFGFSAGRDADVPVARPVHSGTHGAPLVAG